MAAAALHAPAQAFQVSDIARDILPSLDNIDIERMLFAVILNLRKRIGYRPSLVEVDPIGDPDWDACERALVTGMAVH